MPAVISSSVDSAAAILARGEVVAIPTETVYGLAANALDPAAVIKIFDVKKRPHFDPLIVHVSGRDEMKKYASAISDDAYRLAERFWPGPLTIVLKKRDIVPDIVTSGLETVGLRMPDHPLTLELLRKLDFPLAAPSANPFGYISPTTPQHVFDQLGNSIPFILDGGPCAVGVESTIIDCSGGKPVILRPGGLSPESIMSIIGRVEINSSSSSSPAAPGMLESHYAPRKKMLLGDIDALIEANPGKTAILSFCKKYSDHLNFVLSPSGDLHEAAKNLFAAMRALDNSDAELIIAEPVPDEGLGKAINDRLRRAAK